MPGDPIPRYLAAIRTPAQGRKLLSSADTTIPQAGFALLYWAGKGTKLQGATVAHWAITHTPFIPVHSFGVTAGVRT